MPNDKYFSYAMIVAIAEQADEEMRVCHGFLTPEMGDGTTPDLGDYSESFAWIESAGRVYTYRTNLEADGAQDFIPEETFYKAYQPTFIKKYPVVQALRLRGRLGTAGPWEDELRKKRPLLPDDDTLVTNKIRARKAQDAVSRPMVTVGKLRKRVMESNE